MLAFLYGKFLNRGQKISELDFDVYFRNGHRSPDSIIIHEYQKDNTDKENSMISQRTREITLVR
jgi:hypothetical protein